MNRELPGDDRERPLIITSRPGTRAHGVRATVVQRERHDTDSKAFGELSNSTLSAIIPNVISTRRRFMRVRDLFFCLAVALSLGVTARADDPFALRILYAGNPGSRP